MDVYDSYDLDYINAYDTSVHRILRYGDTVVTAYQHTFPIVNFQLEKFKEIEEKSGFNATIEHGNRGFDGIGFSISKINHQQDTIFLHSLNPNRTNKFAVDYKILDAFFSLAYAVIDDEKGTDLIESIQEYFHYQMIRKTKSNPLEYRIYGKINKGCQLSYNRLYSHLKYIPEQTIIFDCKKGAISHCLYWLFEEIAKTKDVYFYGEKKNRVIQCWK